MWIGNREEFWKLTFRALVLHRFKHILSFSTKDTFILLRQLMRMKIIFLLPAEWRHKQYRKLYRISTALAFIIADIIILRDIISLDS